jgi:hypothetical protein
LFIDKILVSAAEYLCILIHSSKSYGSSIPISVKGSSSVDPSVHRALICYPAVVVFSLAPHFCSCETAATHNTDALLVSPFDVSRCSWCIHRSLPFFLTCPGKSQLQVCGRLVIAIAFQIREPHCISSVSFRTSVSHFCFGRSAFLH